MVILEQPYVSEHLLSYLEVNTVPVLNNSFAKSHSNKYNLNLVEDEELRACYKKTKKLYLTSENALDWMYSHLEDESIINQINIIKNKADFREIIKDIYPHFFFDRVHYDELITYDSSKLPFPIVLKPAVGFFSLGVYVINDLEEWENAIEHIRQKEETFQKQFPKSVVDINEFIIEAYIEGTEYAIDAYYNEQGKPIILNIFTHRFASADDVSDRVYYTSKEIIETYKEPFTNFLEAMNKKLNLTNFPMHVEIRVNEEEIIPIEVNPMRFAGLSCTDIAYYAYGINTVDYYLNNKVPDFDQILKDKAGKLYSLIVLDKKEDNIPCHKFQYDRLVEDFEKIIMLRKVDTEALNIFGFIFTETREDNVQELDRILHSDLMEYVGI